MRLCWLSVLKLSAVAQVIGRDFRPIWLTKGGTPMSTETTDDIPTHLQACPVPACRGYQRPVWSTHVTCPRCGTTLLPVPDATPDGQTS
jgi:hypothetical protein